MYINQELSFIHEGQLFYLRRIIALLANFDTTSRFHFLSCQFLCSEMKAAFSMFFRYCNNGKVSYQK